MASTKAQASVAKYKALRGLNFPNALGEETRVEAGEVFSGLPGEDVRWMLDQGVIELVKESGDDDQAG